MTRRLPLDIVLKSVIVFDIKIKDFRHNIRLFAGSHMTYQPTTNAFASVVTRVMVCIVLTIAALSGLVVKVADILNA